MMKHEFTSAGFAICETGGGLTAWRKQTDKGIYLASADDSATPSDNTAVNWIVGFYTFDGDPLAEMPDITWQECLTFVRESENHWLDVEKLSRYFSALIRAEYTDDELSEVNRRNAQSDMGCATHDFRDANAYMYGAFCALMFRESNSESDTDVGMMNQAWDMSRAAQFRN